MDPHTGVAANVPFDCTHQQEDTGADAGSPLANRDRRSLGPHDPADLECREDLATLAVDVDMEVHFPMQRAPDGIAALESLSNQLEPGSVDDAAELHREGACRRLRCSRSTSLAALELPPPRGTCSACMRARLQSMRRNSGWLRKQYAAQRRGVEHLTQCHWEPPDAVSDCPVLPALTHAGNALRSPGIYMPVPLQAAAGGSGGGQVSADVASV